MMGVSRLGVVGGWSKALSLKLGRARELWRRRVVAEEKRRVDGGWASKPVQGAVGYGVEEIPV